MKFIPLPHFRINVKKLNNDAIIPTKGTKFSAGYDLYANESVQINPGDVQKIRTGLAIEIPTGYFGAVYARSGLATKQGLRPANCVGVIDSDYRGELIVALFNDSTVSREVNKGDRIAQIVITPYFPFEFNEVDELSDTERGEGGFGSTG